MADSTDIGGTKKKRKKKTMEDHEASNDSFGVIPTFQSLADEPDAEAATVSTGSNSETRKGAQSSHTRDSSLPSTLPSPADIQQQIANIRERVDPDERQAPLCCGSCCDLPRACIIVNIIYLVFMVATLMAHFMGFSFFDRIRLFRGDDIEEEEDSEIQGGNLQGANCFFCTATEQNICGIVFSIIGILGSTKCLFNQYMVLLTGVWYVVDTIIYLVFLNWPAAISAAAYSYPHFALFWALRKGKITRENYSKTEKYCCFCLDATK